MNITWLEALTTTLEGLLTFISPCVLPMIPVYVLYFAGSSEGKSSKRTLARALCFVLGFTALFVALGVFAGSLGALLVRYQREVNLIFGMLMILLGLHYAGVVRISLLEGTLKPNVQMKQGGYLTCAALGAVFAVGWSPCAGPLLGSAMMMAASKASAFAGALLLACYSLGLGVPFVLCALLIDRAKGAFAFIKRHFTLINRVCGAFLVIIGIMMMTGLYARFSLMMQTAAQQTPAPQIVVEAIPEPTVEPTAAPTAEPTAEAVIEATTEPTATAVVEATAAPTSAPEAKKEVAGPVQRYMAPDFVSYDDPGNPVKLSDMRGKPVVVNFFASWCGPCKIEMPYFDEFYKKYGDQVEFMMVNLCAFGNDTKENGKAMVEAGGWTFPVYFDIDGDAAVKYAIRSMPTTIFVSPEGELKGRHTGVISREALEETIQAMIADM